MNSVRAILIASLSFVLLFFGQTHAADKTFAPGNPDQVKNPDNNMSVSRYVSGNGPGGSCPVIGAISGRVTNAVGTGIADVDVWVYDTDDNWVSGSATGLDGTYTVSNLVTGSYKVKFYPQLANTYATEWYNNKITFGFADTVTVEAPYVTSGINAKLAVGGGISGKVTGEDGAEIAYTSVSVYYADGSFIDYVFAGEDGTYAISGLAAGNYKVKFNDPAHSGGLLGVYAPQWYSNKPDFDTANAVSVGAADITMGIDAKLTVGGSISGKVAGPDGAETPDVYVNVYDSDGNRVGYAYTGENGTYTISGLATGSYKVKFSSYIASYAAQWYKNKNNFNTASAVAVTAPNETSGINVKLSTGGSLLGRVTDLYGNGLDGIQVYVYDTDRNYVHAGYTGNDGSYIVHGMASGNYKVAFDTSDVDYIGEWYSNKTAFNTANVVTVIAPYATWGINAALEAAGAISGKVTDLSGAGIEFVNVRFFDACGNWLGVAFTGADGAYTVHGLPAGSYKVSVIAPYKYVDQWYKNKTSFESADPVTVTVPQITLGIDVVLAEKIVRILNNEIPYYFGSSIQEVYGYSFDGEIIQVQKALMDESLTLGSDVSIKIEGGYNGNFSTNSGEFTTLNGNLLIKGGTVTIENFIIR
jgi:hypothetical protein